MNVLRINEKQAASLARFTADNAYDSLTVMPSADLPETELYVDAVLPHRGIENWTLAANGTMILYSDSGNQLRVLFA